MKIILIKIIGDQYTNKLINSITSNLKGMGIDSVSKSGYVNIIKSNI